MGLVVTLFEQLFCLFSGDWLWSHSFFCVFTKYFFGVFTSVWSLCFVSLESEFTQPISTMVHV